jgi:hypothetical protein
VGTTIKVPSSTLMIPLSYASILGGTITLIGTSTNLVVNGQYQALTGKPGFACSTLPRSADRGAGRHPVRRDRGAEVAAGTTQSGPDVRRHAQFTFEVAVARRWPAGRQDASSRPDCAIWSASTWPRSSVMAASSPQSRQRGAAARR